MRIVKLIFQKKLLHLLFLILAPLSYISTFVNAADSTLVGWNSSDIMYIDNTITDFMIKYDIPGSSVKKLDTHKYLVEKSQ